jgi:CO/xanthine dehydrogenase FAD-binding subunit
MPGWSCNPDPGGSRILAAAEAVASPYETRFEPDEILTGILIGKLSSGTRSAYEKVARRKAMARSYMSVSLVVGFGSDGVITDARIVPGAFEAVARRVPAAEKVLLKTRGERPVALKAAETLVGGMRGVWVPEYKEPVLKAVFLRVLERLL